MRSTVASYQKLTITKSIIKADPLITTWDVAKELNVDHAMVVQHLEQFGKVKKLDKWVSHKLTKNQKKLSFWGVIFSYSTQQQWTISRLDCDVRGKVDFIQQPVMTSSAAGPRSSFKALPKAKTCTKKRSWSLEVCCQYDPLTTAFWILVKPLHQRSILSKLMICTKNCNTCSRHRSIEWVQFSTTTPHHMSYNQSFKSWTNRATKFCLIHHIHLTSHQLTTISSSILIIFCREKHFHNQQEAENDFQEFIKSWSRDFYATGINKHFSLAKMCCL